MNNNNIDMLDVTKFIVNCVFDCFMPEMQEEVVKQIKDKDLKSKEKTKTKSNEEEESKYVQMEPIGMHDFDKSIVNVNQMEI